VTPTSGIYSWREESLLSQNAYGQRFQIAQTTRASRPVYSLNNESLTADKAELSAYFAGLLDSCQRLTRQTKSVLIAQRNFICTKILKPRIITIAKSKSNRQLKQPG
jgi:hypothetical protein